MIPACIPLPNTSNHGRQNYRIHYCRALIPDPFHLFFSFSHLMSPAIVRPATSVRKSPRKLASYHTLPPKLTDPQPIESP
jgi:hypothetical protein